MCIGVEVLPSSAFSMAAYALLSNAPRVTEVLLDAADEEPAVVIMLFIILKDSVCIARRALNGVDGAECYPYSD